MPRRGIKGMKVFSFEVSNSFFSFDKPFFFGEYSGQYGVGYLRLLRIDLTKDSRSIN